MSPSPSQRRTRLIAWGAALLLLAGITALLALNFAGLRDRAAEYFKLALRSLSRQENPPGAAHDGDHPHAHGDHSHGHGGEGDEASIEISEQGLKNIGFRPLKVAYTTRYRKVTLPGMVVERPGWSQIQITAPLTGIVTRMYAIEGEAIEPGKPLFDVRLTHEDLVAAQRDFLRSAEELDVVNREITRLESVGEGVLAGRLILEKKYERQKLEAALKAQRQALLLHGLSDQQADNILKTRTLLDRLTVTVPGHTVECVTCRQDHLFHVQQLRVQQGQQVDAGDTLATLADHCELYIEGQAFEDDIEPLRLAAAKQSEISVALLSGDRREPVATGLSILYLADRVERDSRAFHFYVKLPNEVVLDRQDGPHRFLQWRFKPGQRVELHVPLPRQSEGEDQVVVLPLEAVVQEAAESYVYRQNGQQFQRVPVHVLFRDGDSAVIAADGTLFAGDVLAARGAFQMHVALKNKAAGPIDPHAGHSH